MLQNILQAYTKSKSKLNCIIIYYLSIKLKKKYFESTILFVVKLLYGLTKTENHQFIINLDYYKEKLEIKMSPYDAYFFITKNNSENIGIAKFQIDNTLNIRTEIFMKKEETEIIEAKFRIKSQIILKTGASKNFNSY